MTTRSESYRENQKQYDQGRVPAAVETDETQGRRRRTSGERRRSYDRSRPRRTVPRKVVGVDGEGQDIFVCKRCEERVPAIGGACPKGGGHVLTFGCDRCGLVRDLVAGPGLTLDEPCPAAFPASCDRTHRISIRADGHIYTYLAAVDEHGRLVAEAYNADGLSHDESAEMILAIPRNTLRFGFMFSYDVTKIVEQMPKEKIYALMRPRAREVAVCKDKACKAESPRRATVCTGDARRMGCGGTKLRRTTKPLDWNGRSYDFFNGSLTISASKDGRPRSSKIWDCFRFYGCSFVSALIDWSSCKWKDCGKKGEPGLLDKLQDGSYRCRKCGLGPPEGAEPPVATASDIELVSSMKDKRGSFDVEDPDDVKRYCRLECHLLARAMRRLVDSHDAAGIPLKRYDGAGSTATALLRLNEVAEFKGPTLRELEELHPGISFAIACAFFGGRFEDSMVGSVREPCHGYDISSAYPYALTHLPCLVCGYWRREERMTEAKLAAHEKKGNLVLARFHVRHVETEERLGLAWCPLPFRSEAGSISYGTHFSGWAWAPELSAAMRGWPGLVNLDGDAWVYEKRCDHQPFAFLPEVYRQRIGWGKEGAGKVLKLGMNASYGKTAQSIGDDPPFQSWIWAGYCTATTRGQLLDAIASAKDRWNVLAVATDGVYTLEQLPIKEPPRITGTHDLGKPLGGWEYKAVPEGIFIAKPGMYWSNTMEFVRARGIGRRELRESFTLIERSFEAWDRETMDHTVTLKSRRFFGAKSSILGRSGCDDCKVTWPGALGEKACYKCKRCGSRFAATSMTTERGREAYGTWDLRTIKVAFDPFPKRERVGISKGGTYGRLHVRDLEGLSSWPYPVGAGRTTPEGEQARASQDFELEQPDWNGD